MKDMDMNMKIPITIGPNEYGHTLTYFPFAGRCIEIKLLLQNIDVLGDKLYYSNIIFEVAYHEPKMQNEKIAHSVWVSNDKIKEKDVELRDFLKRYFDLDNILSFMFHYSDSCLGESGRYCGYLGIGTFGDIIELIESSANKMHIFNVEIDGIAKATLKESKKSLKRIYDSIQEQYTYDIGLLSKKTELENNVK